MKVDGTAGFNLVTMAHDVAEAEATGYAGLWVAETSHDPFVSVALAAPHSTRCELGTAIAVAFARNPMTTAMAANDLQLACGGRFLLGLGSQIKPHIERRFSMPWSHPAPRMREYIMAMRAIWECWNDGHQARLPRRLLHAHLDDALLQPGSEPARRRRRSSSPSVGQQMTEVAGEVADGMLVHAFTTERYLREVTMPALRARPGPGRQDPSGRRALLPRLRRHGRHRGRARAAAAVVRQQIAFYGSTPAYRGVLELHGWGELQPELNRMSKRGQWTEMAGLIDDEMLDAFAVVASPEELGPKVVARFGTVVDRFSFYARFGLAEERLRVMLAGFGLERAAT